MISLPTRFQPSVSFGGAEIQRTEDGRWRTEFEHRGSKMELFADSMFALRDTLLELKKTQTPLEECLEKMDDWSYLRLYEVYTTRPTEGPWHQRKDEWLLLNGLVFYGVKHEKWESTWPASNPERYPLSLTEKGSEVCSKLFFEPKQDLDYKEKQALHADLRGRMVESIYSAPVGYERPSDVFVALHWGHKVLAISESRDGAFKALLRDTKCGECENTTMRLIKVKKDYRIPPMEKIRVSDYWVKYCTELLWEKKWGTIVNEEGAAVGSI